MINEVSVSSVNQSKFSSDFRKPLYESYCFANIPQTILSCFSESPSALPHDTLVNPSRKYSKVVLFFIDAFGWRFFEKHRDQYPALKRLVEGGVVSKLTSQFPSTTVAHVTTINTGLPVGQHGLYEWNYYEPKFDAVIQPFLFSYAGEKERNTLASLGVDPKEIFPEQNLFSQLSRHEVATHQYMPREISGGAYSEVVTQGAIIHPYVTLADGLTNLALQLKTDKRGYYYLYYSEIDTISHLYGPDSVQVEAQIDHFLRALEHLFLEKLAGKLDDTLFLMTADHGQVDANPTECFYINQELPQLLPWLEVTGEGKPMIPVGSPRDFFLHVRQEQLEKAKTLLESKLEDVAEVHLTQDLMAQGFFGPLPLSDVFLGRVGNLVILPYAHHSVWWFEEGRFWSKYVGHHGGLTPEEMETILYAFEL